MRRRLGEGWWQTLPAGQVLPLNANRAAPKDYLVRCLESRLRDIDLRRILKEGPLSRRLGFKENRPSFSHASYWEDYLDPVIMNTQSSTTQRIVSQLRKFHARKLLGGINRIAVALEKEPGRVKMIPWPKIIFGRQASVNIAVTTHGLAALAKFVIAHGSEHSGSKPGARDIIYLQNQIEHLPSTISVPTESPMSLEQFLVQLSSQQFDFQQKAEWADLGRTIILFQTVPELLESEASGDGFDMFAATRSLYGMTLTQFLWCGLFIFGHAISASVPYMSLKGSMKWVDGIEDHWVGNQKDMPTGDHLRRFVEITARDIPWFKQEIGDLRRQDETVVARDFMPLQKFPLVKLNSNEIVVPIPKLLIERITTGVFHDFAEFSEGDGARNRFRAYFGRVFERYVGLLLAQVFPESDLYAERPYGPRGSPRTTPDWTVAGKRKPVAIECRSSTFRQMTKLQATDEQLRSDLLRIGVETMTKAPSKLADLTSGDTGIPVDRSNPPTLCLCTYEDIEPLGLYGSMLHAQLTNEGSLPEVHLIPLPYMEFMCAVGEESAFMNSLSTLQIDNSWGDPNGKGPETAWKESMPEDYAQNPLVNEATQQLFSALDLGDDQSSDKS